MFIPRLPTSTLTGGRKGEMKGGGSAVAVAMETKKISHVHRDCLDKQVASWSDQHETRRI